jgi:hypothetical protein
MEIFAMTDHISPARTGALSRPSFVRSTCRAAAVALALGSIAGLASAGCSGENAESSERIQQSLSTALVISQIFAGGGNTNAPFRHDFVELWNRGNAPVRIAGHSIQYATEGRAFSRKVDLPDVTVPGGGFYLVRLGSSGARGAALPAPDWVAEDELLNLQAISGRVALVASTTLLACGGPNDRCDLSQTIDFVGYGSASDFRRAPAESPGNTRALVRARGGCDDRGNNRFDFTLAAPAPRNSLTTPRFCDAVESDGGPVVLDDAGGADAHPEPDSAAEDAAVEGDGEAPGTSLPDADVPSPDLPDADVPSPDLPDADVPDANTQDASRSDGDTPDARPEDAAVPPRRDSGSAPDSSQPDVTDDGRNADNPAGPRNPDSRADAPDSTDGEGCACRSAGGLKASSTNGAAAFIAFALVLLRRRGRGRGALHGSWL